MAYELGEHGVQLLCFQWRASLNLQQVLVEDLFVYSDKRVDFDEV